MNTSRGTFDGVTIWPCSQGWQVSTRNLDGSWNVTVAENFEEAITHLSNGEPIMATAAKGKPGRKPAVNEVAGVLQTALKFLSVGHKPTGDMQAQHTWFINGWGASFDGVIAAGFPTPGIDFQALPHTKLLADAMTNVGKELELTVTDNGIKVKSGSYEAIIPNGDLAALKPLVPDDMKYPMDSTFRDALGLASKLVSDTSTELAQACIVTHGVDNQGAATTLLATNGRAIIEVRAGTQLPPGILFPKAFANALAKVSGEIKGFGFSAESFTVWFDHGGFLRTQLYRETYPQDILSKADKLMTAPATVDVPKGLIDAVAAVAPFGGGDQVIRFGKGTVSAVDGTATIKQTGIKEGFAVPAKALLTYLDVTSTIWFGDAKDQPARIVLYGANFRAAISAVEVEDEPAHAEMAPPPPQQQMFAPPPQGFAPPPQAQHQAQQQSVQQTVAAQVNQAWGQQPSAAQTDLPLIGTLPYTPVERQQHIINDPSWQVVPYDLRQGERIGQFQDLGNIPAVNRHGLMQIMQADVQAMAAGQPPVWTPPLVNPVHQNPPQPAQQPQQQAWGGAPSTSSPAGSPFGQPQQQPVQGSVPVQWAQPSAAPSPSNPGHGQNGQQTALGDTSNPVANKGWMQAKLGGSEAMNPNATPGFAPGFAPPQPQGFGNGQTVFGNVPPPDGWGDPENS